LSLTALKRNLESHAKVNHNISVGGTKEEMMERLERILKAREGDLVVKEMIWGEEGET